MTLPALPDNPKARVARFNVVFFLDRWNEALPPAAVQVVGALAIAGPLARGELRDYLAATRHESKGLQGTAWRLAAADQISAGETDDLLSRQTAVDRHSAALGVAPVRTLADLLEFLVACRVVTVDDQSRYAFNSAAPPPTETLLGKS